MVKYADTEKERQARRMQKAMQQFAQLNLSPLALIPGYPQLYAQVYLHADVCLYVCYCMYVCTIWLVIFKGSFIFINWHSILLQ